MVMDRNGRSHAPAGTPGGGRFDGAANAAGDGDLGDPDGAPARGGIDPDRIADTPDNRRRMLELARTINGWNGTYDEFEVTDDPADILPADDPVRVANMVFFGSYRPNADWHRLDGYGNLESVDEADLEAEAWDERADIIADAEDGDDVDYSELLAGFK